MRKLTVVLFLALLAVLMLAQTPGNRPQDLPGREQLPAQGAYGHTGSMWRLAEFRVVPYDIALAQRKELSSLRARVELAKMESAKLNTSDPAVREQLARQIELMEALLAWADKQNSDDGKSPEALEVQRRLNNIEGKIQCEACHGGLVGQMQQPSPVSGGH